MYYLAFIRSYGKADGYYLLVMADTIEEAQQKVINEVGDDKIIDITDTLK